jgi:uncharacterized protein
MAIDILIILITSILMIMGLMGSVLPMLPGPPLIFLGALIYAWHTNFMIISWGTLIIFVFFVMLGQFLDYFATVLGAKKYGASRWGMVGAFLGGVIGIFIGGVLGIIIGPFFGAIALELLQGKAMDVSLKIGLGTIVGFLGGAIGKLIISIIMIGIFLIRVIPH